MTAHRQWLEARRLDFAQRMQTEPFDHQSWCAHYGVSKSTIFRWRTRYLQNGVNGLKATRAGGPPCRLSPLQEADIKSWLHRNQVWTPTQVRTHIGQSFGVWYHPDHVYRLLQRWGWRCHLR